MKIINSIIITNISDMCHWLKKDNIRIVDMVPVKGIAGEDILRIEYYHKERES